MHPSFASLLSRWYHTHARSLPWRTTRDPYRIWLSEVILQQTRVAQGLPYYQRFTELYPTLHHLAQASEQAVLRCWQGLGYYRRARLLLQCAREVAERHGGEFPRQAAELQKLPGIGVYTAAAVASFAFGERVAVIDGNVHRVLSRLLGLEGDRNSAVCQQAAQKLLPVHSSALYNQGIMEFGAVWCTPVAPRCATCPFQDFCYAYQAGRVEDFPQRKARKPLRPRYFHYWVLEHREGLFLQQRQGSDIWEGLYEFARVESEEAGLPGQVWAGSPMDSLLAAHPPSPPYTAPPHLLTHQRIYPRFYPCYVGEPLCWQERLAPLGLRPYTWAEVEALPLPVPLLRYLRRPRPAAAPPGAGAAT